MYTGIADDCSVTSKFSQCQCLTPTFWSSSYTWPRWCQGAVTARGAHNVARSRGGKRLRVASCPSCPDEQQSGGTHLWAAFRMLQRQSVGYFPFRALTWDCKPSQMHAESGHAPTQLHSCGLVSAVSHLTCRGETAAADFSHPAGRSGICRRGGVKGLLIYELVDWTGGSGRASSSSVGSVPIFAW